MTGKGGEEEKTSHYTVLNPPLARRQPHAGNANSQVLDREPNGGVRHLEAERIGTGQMLLEVEYPGGSRAGGVVEPLASQRW